uniref:THAP-type domain-containing protein n=4 Tax=Photinus pyralis TaxID=7054 RepID=A0A1Y1K320_PHOPY
MVGCCVVFCTNRSSKPSKRQIKEENENKITFHIFPKDAERKQRWKNAIRRENWEPSNNSVVCSAHFRTTDFINSANICKLKMSAVPSVFKDYPLYLQKIQKIRKSPKNRIPLAVIQKPSIVENVEETETSAETIIETMEVGFDTNETVCHAIENNTQSSRSFNTICSSCTLLKSTITKLSGQLLKAQRKIKMLQQAKRRSSKKVATMNNVIKALKTQFPSDTANIPCLDMLSKESAQLLHRQASKRKNLRIAQKYPPELRKFALTLHYYSPASYRYVRDQFDTCLPHPKTISRWYRSIDAKPGFSSEALQAIKMKAANTPYKIVASLVFDEMSIRRKIEYDGLLYHGFLDMGANVDVDESTVAKEALVFMLVSINSNWKVPVGYFLTAGLGVDQKSSLIRTCLTLLQETGVNVISITFDGLSTNFSLMTNLGCQINTDLQLKPYFSHPVTKERVYVFPDPPNMLKLVRNALADKKVLYDSQNSKIEWNLLEKLHDLQDKEGLHLANKLRGVHIHFQNQKMKVKLATQLLSRSVAVALSICKDKLQMQEFKESTGTITFLDNFNNLFDIMNSRSIKQFDFKKPINANNFEYLFNELDKLQKYIQGLKFDLISTSSVIYSNRRTGFLGFMICIESLKLMVHEMILSKKLLAYIPTYKMSQDHVELFFSAIRAHTGFNNNPTARQFKSAFKKLLIQAEFKNSSNGNCVPLECFSILHCSSTRESTRAVEIINETCFKKTHTDDDLDVYDDITDHNYVQLPGQLTEFTKQIVAYMGGFVVRKLLKKIKCEECIEALTSSVQNVPLIALRDKGGLISPSDDVINICMTSETILKRALEESGGKMLLKKFSCLFLVGKVLKVYLNKPIFIGLSDHVLSHIAIENHVIQLIRAVAESYIVVRLHYVSKRYTDTTNSKRQVYNKLILFQGC